METNHNITTNDLLSIMGYTALAVVLMFATFIALAFKYFILFLIFVVLTFLAANKADTKYNEIRTKLGIR